MAEFGIFSDEGQIEADFHSKEDAQHAINERYSSEDELEVHECCPWHPEEIADSCELCLQEDSEEDDE